MKNTNYSEKYHLTEQLHTYSFLYRETLESVRVVTLENITRLKFSERDCCENILYSCEHNDFFDCAERKSSYSNANPFLIEILKKFPIKEIEVFSLLGSEESTSSNIAMRCVSLLPMNFNPFVGHFCYANIKIDPTQKIMNIKVVDPVFSLDRLFIRSVMASPEPLSEKSEKFFQSIAQSSGLVLADHAYHYRGDQVQNFHDCGRFSTIYLHAELEGKDCMYLSNFEMYQGFKKLEG